MGRLKVISIFFIAVLLLVIPVYAQNATRSADVSSLDITKSYQCLENLVKSRPSLSLQEAIFASLALGNVGNASAVIDREKSSTEDCWPRAGCKVKETAQVALAYKKMGRNTDGIKNWLSAHSGNAVDLTWYLETDIEGQKSSSCTISYDSREYRINVQENMQISGSAGPCLEISNSKYLLKIGDRCMDKTFGISCNQSFVTTTVYQKSRGSSGDCLNQNNITCFLSGETHSASSLGQTEEKVNSKCFKSGSSCDYEGSLWATLAFSKMNAQDNVSATMPYLLALSDDNERYFPYSFLSILTGDDDQYSKVIEKRQQGQFWEIANSPNNRFYDTSLGMLALSSGSGSSNDLGGTQDYLLGIRTKEGCWNNNRILDTGFILYSGWTRQGTIYPGGGGGSSAFCEEAGFSCERLSDCKDSGGVEKQGFECAGFGICCSVKIQKQTCEKEGGKTCTLREQCDGRSFESGSGACCVGSCVPIPVVNVCEQSPSAVCKASCGSGEDEVSDSCGVSGKVCCIPQSSGGGSYLWIIILIVLIILAVLAIIFRHKLQIWWFKFRGGVKSTPVVRPGPPSSPRMMVPRAMQRPFSPQGQQMPIRRAMPNQPRDVEMDETLKKLREMSK